MTAAVTAPNYLPKVREQYEAMPYPPYDPAQDKVQLNTTWNDRLDYLNHRFFDGRQRFGSDFRVLCAGDGTGNASIFLAEQLAELGGLVVSLDLSAASQAIAKERAAIRNLTNITHINASLLDIPSLNLGEFDVISCPGVLHHLSDPDAGLRTLAASLKPHGVMAVMVYAAIGRMPIYYLQEALRTLFQPDTSVERQLEVTRTMLAELPHGNWFWFNNTSFMKEISDFGDAGIFDMLLHSQDRAYTVGQCYDWAERCGLTLHEFSPLASHEELRYNPCHLIPDAAFAHHAGQLSKRQQQTIAELLVGNIIMHNFYVTRHAPPAELSGDDHSLIASWGLMSPIAPTNATAAAASLRSASEQKLATLMLPGSPARPVFTPSACAPDFILAVDGQRTIGQLLDEVATKHPTLSRAAIETQWQQFYAQARLNRCLVLRRAEGAGLPTGQELHQRSLARMKA